MATADAATDRPCLPIFHRGAAAGLRLSTRKLLVKSPRTRHRKITSQQYVRYVLFFVKNEIGGYRASLQIAQLSQCSPWP